MDEDFFEELLYIEYLENHPRENEEIEERRNDIEDLNDTKFLQKYRLSKNVVLKVLEEIENYLEYRTDRNNPFTPIQQVLMTLRFYATGTFQIVIGEVCGASKATVCRVVKKVTEAIASLRPRYISFPTSEEATSVKQKFYQIAHFPSIVGTIDCTHIPILSPGGDNAEVFRNRKGYFSINVQTICNADLVTRDIVARWPGSVHDSTIFQNCHKRALFEDRQIEGLLLGDSGYPLRPFLMTPFLNPGTLAEEAYNAAHIRTRNTVDRSYGIWKRRFPVIKMGLRLKIQTSLAVIVATAVLNNIAIQMRDVDAPEDMDLVEYLHQIGQQEYFEDVQATPLENVIQQGEAARTRNAIVARHFTAR